VFTTPGSTTAIRSSGSTERMRSRRLRAITTPSATGSAPPHRLVPLPRATNGIRHSRQARTTVITSSRVRGTTTASGRVRKTVRPSLS